MYILNFRIWVGLLVVLTLVVSGCAEYSVQKNNSDVTVSSNTSPAVVEVAQPTRQAHTSEEAASAIYEAKRASKRAEEIGGLWRDTGKLIKKAEAALKQNNVDKAFKVANNAIEQADLALNQTYLEKANHNIGLINDMTDKDDTKMTRRINEAEMAYINEEGEEAYALALGILEELDSLDSMQDVDNAEQRRSISSQRSMTASQASSRAAPVAVKIDVTRSGNNEMGMDDEYKVVSGDSLWGISGKPSIYNNPYQWPLIYKANSQKISDPDVIHPGQVLGIKRMVSEVEINAAIVHAKKRGQWSLDEIEMHDEEYLADDVATR